MGGRPAPPVRIPYSPTHRWRAGFKIGQCNLRDWPTRYNSLPTPGLLQGNLTYACSSSQWVAEVAVVAQLCFPSPVLPAEVYRDERAGSPGKDARSWHVGGMSAAFGACYS